MNGLHQVEDGCTYDMWVPRRFLVRVGALVSHATRDSILRSLVLMQRRSDHGQIGNTDLYCFGVLDPVRNLSPASSPR